MRRPDLRPPPKIKRVARRQPETTRDSNPARDNSTTPAEQSGFLVIESKSTGREVAMGPYASEAEARSVARLIAWAGGVVRVERAP